MSTTEHPDQGKTAGELYDDCVKTEWPGDFE